MQDKKDEEAIEIGEFKVYARCLAGVASCCYIDSLDIAFDIGCIFGQVQSKSNIFITHGHIDHINAFMAHAGRRSLVKSEPATYYVPNHLKESMEKIREEFCQMQEVR
jgi:ribonuclease Z